MANLEDCEKKPRKAHLLNSEFPGWLAEKCARHSIKLVHISTDAVFDAPKNGKYSETDIPHPLSVYAQSKWLVSWQCGRLTKMPWAAREFLWLQSSGQRSLANLSAQSGNGTSIKGFTDVFFSPLYVIDLVEYLMHCVKKSWQVVSSVQFGIITNMILGCVSPCLQPERRFDLAYYRVRC
jgi:dTDP-4-dehydrorhamnose reductase